MRGPWLGTQLCRSVGRLRSGRLVGHAAREAHVRRWSGDGASRCRGGGGGEVRVRPRAAAWRGPASTGALRPPSRGKGEGRGGLGAPGVATQPGRGSPSPGPGPGPAHAHAAQCRDRRGIAADAPAPSSLSPPLHSPARTPGTGPPGAPRDARRAGGDAPVDLYKARRDTVVPGRDTDASTGRT